MTLSVEIVAAGDPYERSTWSGTPLALATALSQIGCAVTGFSPMPEETTLTKAASAAITTARYGVKSRKFRQYVGPVNRQIRTSWASHARAATDTPRLHTDVFWLPRTAPMKGRNLLYRDTSPTQLIEGIGARRSMAKVLQERFASLPHQMDHVYTTSEWARQGFIAEGFSPERVTAVGTGIGFAPPQISDDQLREASASGVTLCVAKVRFHNKGLDLLVEGFSRARMQLPHLRLVVVAPPGVVKPGPGIEVLSDLSYPDLISLYARAALYAMPARYEPWGLVYLEALACGTPVLGSIRAAFPELCRRGETGYIVEKLTPESVAESLLRAHGDSDSLLEKSRAALVHRDHQGWRRAALAIADGLEESETSLRS